MDSFDAAGAIRRPGGRTAVGRPAPPPEQFNGMSASSTAQHGCTPVGAAVGDVD